MRIVVLVLTTLVALTASVPVASASTVGRDQFGFLLFRGEGAEENRLTMTETDADYVFEDAPSITLTPGDGCRDDGDAATTNVVLCAKNNRGVTVVELGDGDDEIVEVDVDFEGYLYRGGEGDDVLRASSGFRSSVTMHGEGGTDTYFPGRPQQNFEVVSYMHRSDDLVLTMNDAADDPEGESVPSTMTGVVGGFGDDLLVGSGKGDYLAGGNGNDRAQGMGGSDNVNGSNGDDLLEGGDGNDVFPGEVGADRVVGGEGFDRFEVRNSGYDMGVGRDVTVTLDDVANDGGSGERDDVRSDVEDVTAVPAGNSGRATLVGDASVNVLRGSREGDTLDGGAGSDLL
ncbi:MAG: Alkaline phosphatase, partial [uncultured Solirubrobacteraceae bacterium]